MIVGDRRALQRALAEPEQVLRDTPSRHVRRHGQVVLKLYRRSFLLPRGWREWRRARRLERRGVPVARPLGAAVRFGFPWLRLDAFACEWVPGESLGAWAERYLRTPPERRPLREKHRLTREFARLVRLLHERGVVHRDLHARNVMIAPQGQLRLVDLQALRLRRRLSWRERLRNLVEINRGFMHNFSAADRLRFLFAYLGGRPSGWKEMARRIELASLRASWEHWARRERRIWGENSEFARLRDGDWRGHVRREFPREGLQELARAMAEGRPLKRGHATAVLSASLAGRPVAIKAFVKARRLWRAWRGANALWTRGAPVAKPLAALEGPCGRVLVAEWIPRARPLRRFLAEASPAQRRELLLRGAWLLGRMHRNGAFHGDLKASNVLVCPGPRPLLVDLDAARGGAFRRRAALRDLARLYASVGAQLRATERWLFLWHYLRASGGWERPEALWREVPRRARRWFGS